MNAYEFNKIAGWVLSAFLSIFGMKELGEIASASHHGAEKPGYTLPAPKVSASGGAQVDEGFKFPAVAALMAKASVDNGKDVFKQCATCHTPEKGGAVKQGPNLYGIVGRDVGKVAGFAYSPAMMAKGGKWDWAAVAAYLNDPKGNVPGNKMAFAGVKDNGDLADVLVYLRTLADSPAALPAAK